MSYYFSSESVSEGHPDKIADQISDAILDNFLAIDPESKVACETLVTTGLVVLSGEIKSNAVINPEKIARDVIRRIGYTKSEYKFDADSCGIITALHEQSQDINRGVERENPEQQGAGDQGMMFGYATSETETKIPLPLYLAHEILRELAAIRREGKQMTYLRPDAKSQVTIKYSDDHKPLSIETIVVSTQHDPFDTDEQKMQSVIKQDIINILIPRVLERVSPDIRALFDNDITYHINPTGKFVIGGPHGDTGLTGRKIIVDTYGGKGAHGGGAFSGKDPSKVDRSAAYAARHIAKNLVAAGIADEVLVQVAYAIGIEKPMNIYVNTYGTSKVDLPDSAIASIVEEMFDMTPAGIIKRLKLKQPMFFETAAYGHMGRKNEIVRKTFDINGQRKEMDIELFTWEKEDYVEPLRERFNLASKREVTVN